MAGATAILAVRNEEAYLDNCLRHLVRNGLSVAIIDNGSTDATPQICRRAEFKPHIVGIWPMPFNGVFSLEAQLRLKLEVASQIDTDWAVHVDADEMMHSYVVGETLAEGLDRLGRLGWNVVNFDEFVFLPVDRNYRRTKWEFPKLRYYYHFAPYAPRLMRAWRNGLSFSMLDTGGHALVGADLKLAPESFALRHYMFRSQRHAFDKYVGRVFATEDLNRGWHGNRLGFAREDFRFPRRSRLKRVQDVAARNLDRSEPWATHYWQVA